MTRFIFEVAGRVHACILFGQQKEIILQAYFRYVTIKLLQHKKRGGNKQNDKRHDLINIQVSLLTPGVYVFLCPMVGCLLRDTYTHIFIQIEKKLVLTSFA